MSLNQNVNPVESQTPSTPESEAQRKARIKQLDENYVKVMNEQAPVFERELAEYYNKGSAGK